MKLKKVRFIVFVIWALAYFLCFLMLFFAPHIRGNDIIPNFVAQDGLTKISCLYIPVLVAFTTYWFRANAQQSNTQRKLNKDIAWIALGITIMCNVLIIITTGSVLYLFHFDKFISLSASDNIEHVLNGWVFYLMYSLTAFAAAPLVCLLGVEPFFVSK